MSSEARTLRLRQDSLREAIDQLNRDQEPSVFAMPVELVKIDGKWPDGGDGSQIYMARHITLSGLDTPGTTLTVTKTGEPFRVFNLGNGTPPDPDLGVPTRTLIVERHFEYWTFTLLIFMSTLSTIL